MTIRLVIEPHADDAFLSLGGHIDAWAKDLDRVVIATVFANPKRCAEARAYADAEGAEHLCLGLAESGSPDADPETSDQLMANYVATLATSAGIASGLERVRVYVPVGIKHREHVLVSDGAKLWANADNAFAGSLRFYLDQPYASAPMNSTGVTWRCQGKTISSYMKPHARKYRHIPLFKSQSKFFHFNPADVLKHNPEIVLKDAR